MRRVVRSSLLKSVMERSDPWDVIVIGGGATGLGIALDSASRGYSTILLEKSDFTKGTSSRSTKLVHGGVRYLRQGQISLVFEALRERGILRSNAPHLVRPLSFVLPAYRWWEKWFYLIGLKIYDLMARHLSFGVSELLSQSAAHHRAESLMPQGLRGGVLYYDGQMDDARLGLALAKTSIEQGAYPLNYVQVTGINLDKESGLHEVKIQDLINEDEHRGSLVEQTLYGRSVINATGVFVDDVRELEDAQVKRVVRPSQGAHLVLPKRFLPGESAIIFPQTSDGRVLFAIPWYERVIVGTTDQFVDQAELEPRPLEEELVSILDHLCEYLDPQPTRDDVLSVFAGLRPLVVPQAEAGTKSDRSASVSREHSVFFGRGGVCHVTGGKWTTYRKMAEDVLESVIKRGAIPHKPCVTQSLRLVGWREAEGNITTENVYGSERDTLESMGSEIADSEVLIHPRLPYIKAEVVYAIRYELAMTVDDVLARRTRALLLDARAAIECAPEVAAIIAQELGRDQDWVKHQVEIFTAIARRYLWERKEEADA